MAYVSDPLYWYWDNLMTATAPVEYGWPISIKLIGKNHQNTSKLERCAYFIGCIGTEIVFNTSVRVRHIINHDGGLWNEYYSISIADLISHIVMVYGVDWLSGEAAANKISPCCPGRAFCSSEGNRSISRNIIPLQMIKRQETLRLQYIIYVWNCLWDNAIDSIVPKSNNVYI